MSYFPILLEKYKKDCVYLDWNKITCIDDNIVKKHDNLSIPQNPNIANKICCIKLNGGLGTTLNFNHTKSFLQIHNYKIIDIIIKNHFSQSHKIPLYFMNSFYSNNETNEYLKNNYIEHEIGTFNQNIFPRIFETDNNLPETKKYYPPGHGDLFEALNNSGTLDKLTEQGIEYIFVSNSDNLGATIDLRILNDIIDNNIDFAMEFVYKSLDDIKGGSLIKYDGHYKMFEIAQCEPNKLDLFSSIEKFKYFNTNNIWIKISEIKKLVQTNYLQDLDIIANKKIIDGHSCVQLEHALGSTVKFFKNISFYLVDRNRFIPIKNINDYESIKNNYILDETTWTLQKKIN